MKLRYFILLTIAAYLIVVAFRSAVEKPTGHAIIKLIAEKKKFIIRCSPLYIPVEGEEIPLLTGWGNYSWKITTQSDSAQIYFNQGINMYYAFHIIEARASFDKATKFDPNCAMAWWGKSLAFGPNINDFEYQRPAEALASASKANDLKISGTAVEKALIEALAVRYCGDTTIKQDTLNLLYRDAMQQVFKKYNTNENVSTLYADALMLIHPWDLYEHNFQPRPWTGKIVSVIKHALRLNPKQPGANHYLIHAVEGSATPGDASASAAFLETAMPSVSHITHMPSHIYIRTGVYDKGIIVNDDAVEGFNKYLSQFPAIQENVGLYVLHNVHMKLNCAQMAGNYKIANASSMELQSMIPGEYLQAPGALGSYIQYMHQSTLFTWLRFGKWEEILQVPVPDTLAYVTILQHFARGMAQVHKNNLPGAVKEAAILEVKMQEPSLKEPLLPFNSAYSVAIIAKSLLAGTIALNQKNYIQAITAFKQAVIDEDNLIYNEPRDWLLPARQYLGDALIKAGRYKEATAVFKQDLIINPNNGWSLTGLATCYRQLHNASALPLVQQRLKLAWVMKDIEITAAVF